MLAPFVGQEYVMVLGDIRRDDLTILGDLMRTGKMTPVIDRRYSLREAPDVLRYSEEGHARRKIIIALE